MKKLTFITILFWHFLSYSQSYTPYVLGRYNVIASWSNGLSNCPSILDLIPSSTYTNCVRYYDSCFVNQWQGGDPWQILVNIDSSMIGCTACGDGTIAAVGKLYYNDSIYLKIKVFGNNWQYRDFKGFKLYSTVTKADELSLPENALLFSPNPSSDIMYIQCTQQNFINEPVLYDLKGAKTNTEINYVNSHTYKVDVSNLPNGIYFVFVQTNQGYLKKKVVVSR